MIPFAVLIPVLIAAMLAFIFWRAAFRLRPDRVKQAREATRGRFDLSPRQRVKLLLDRAFNLPERNKDWEAPLLSRLPPRDGARPEQRRKGR